jgi:hypothetical protein
MANVDDGEFSEEEVQEMLGGRIAQKGRFQAWLVSKAKQEFGLPTRSKANFAMVRKYLRDYMREHGVRESHINQHLVISTALVFIPSEQDIIAHQIGATQDAHLRENSISGLWDSAYGHIGHMLGFKSE